MNNRNTFLIIFSFCILALASFYLGTKNSNAFNKKNASSIERVTQNKKELNTIASNPTADTKTSEDPEPVIEVQTIKPKNNINNSFVEVQGKVNSSKSLSISSIADGKVIKTFISIGDNVTKGQIIAQINNVDSQNDLTSLKSKLEINKSTISNLSNKLKDYEEMLKVGIVARNDIITIKNDINTKKSENEDIKITINKLNNRNSNNILKSPYTGYVNDVVAEGSFVSYGQNVSTIIPLTDQYIEALIPSENLKDIKIGQEVTIKDMSEKGYITNISPVSSFNMVKAIVKTKAHLSLGLDMQLKILIKVLKGLTIPKSCIVIQEGKTAVFIVKDSKAILREIEVEKDNNKDVIISKGLTVKDSVVTKNAGILADGTKVVIK